MLDWITRSRLRNEVTRQASRSFRYAARQMAADFTEVDGGLVLLSGCCRAEVVVETALMLAASLAAEVNVRVVLVDANFRSGELSQRLGHGSAPGLAQLVDDKNADVAQLIKALKVPGVAFLPSGLLSGTTASVNLGLVDLDRIVASLRACCDIVVVVQGPIDSDTRNLVVAAAADLVLIVAEEASTRLGQIDEATAVLRTHGIDNGRVLLSQPPERRSMRAA